MHAAVRTAPAGMQAFLNFFAEALKARPTVPAGTVGPCMPFERSVLPSRDRPHRRTGRTACAARTDQAPPGRRIEPTGPVRQSNRRTVKPRRAARNARAMLAALRRRCVVRRGLRCAQHRRTPRGHRLSLRRRSLPGFALAFVHDFADVLPGSALLAGIAFRLLICHGRKNF